MSNNEIVLRKLIENVKLTYGDKIKEQANKTGQDVNKLLADKVLLMVDKLGLKDILGDYIYNDIRKSLSK